MWWRLLKKKTKKQLNRRKQEQERQAGGWIQILCFIVWRRGVVHKQTRAALVYFMSVSRISGTLASSHARRVSEREPNHTRSRGAWWRKTRRDWDAAWLHTSQTRLAIAPFACRDKNPIKVRWVHTWIKAFITRLLLFNNIELFVEVRSSGRSRSGSGGCLEGDRGRGSGSSMIAIRYRPTG